MKRHCTAGCCLTNSFSLPEIQPFFFFLSFFCSGVHVGKNADVIGLDGNSLFLLLLLLLLLFVFCFFVSCFCFCFVLFFFSYNKEKWLKRNLLYFVKFNHHFCFPFWEKL